VYVFDMPPSPRPRTAWTVARLHTPVSWIPCGLHRETLESIITLSTERAASRMTTHSS